MIPKIVHATWISKDILTCDSFISVNGIQQIRNLNPEWTVTVYDNAEIDEYLKSAMVPQDYALIEHVHVVEKSDIWRLYKIHYEGGTYIDIDRLCNTPFDYFLTDDIKWVLPTCRDFDFSHDFMMSAPGNPAFSEAISLYLERRRAGHTNVYFLGPQTYTHAVTKTLFGNIIDTNPGLATFNNMRETIAQIPFMLTYREDPPNDTILYRNSNRSVDLELTKRELYAKFNLRHWTNEW